MPMFVPLNLREIEGYEGRYSVTSNGRVWSHPRVTPRRDGQMRPAGGRWLTPVLHQAVEYPTVSLCRDGVTRKYLVHRLVAAAWIPNPLGLPQVNHLNGDKSDARIENLEWCSQSENHKHAYRTGLRSSSPTQREAARRVGLSNRRHHAPVPLGA